ncbi:MAG: 30S ribosomal protein S15 [Candidatus Handelsmanbacteria bacterium]|nr:30S ribosomal protein S15 [Candidatus Handelsmanbacteria bacterium]
MSITNEKKKDLTARFGKSETDTGSSAVQIAVLTERIRALSDHLQSNEKDHASRRGLLRLIGKRRRLQNYLHQRQPEKYAQLIKDLELRR